MGGGKNPRNWEQGNSAKLSPVPGATLPHPTATCLCRNIADITKMASTGKAHKFSSLNIIMTNRRVSGKWSFPWSLNSEGHRNEDHLLWAFTLMSSRGAPGTGFHLKLKWHQISLPLTPTINISRYQPTAKAQDLQTEGVSLWDHSTAWTVSSSQQRGSSINTQGHRGRARVTETEF